MRKHLEKLVIVGKNESDILRMHEKGSLAKSGYLLEDEQSFYISVMEVKESPNSTEIFHVKRINDRDTVVILGNQDNGYKSGWYWADFSDYIPKNQRYLKSI